MKRELNHETRTIMNHELTILASSPSHGVTLFKERNNLGDSWYTVRAYSSCSKDIYNARVFDDLDKAHIYFDKLTGSKI